MFYFCKCRSSKVTRLSENNLDNDSWINHEIKWSSWLWHYTTKIVKITENLHPGKSGIERQSGRNEKIDFAGCKFPDSYDMHFLLGMSDV